MISEILFFIISFDSSEYVSDIFNNSLPKFSKISEFSNSLVST